MVPPTPKVPVHLFEFAWNEENHNPTSPNSLRDAWLDSWQIQDDASGDRLSARRVDVDACFLGPLRNRRIHLRYKDVRRLSLTANRGARYGDLLVHEITIEQDGLYSHELIFAGGADAIVALTPAKIRGTVSSAISGR